MDENAPLLADDRTALVPRDRQDEGGILALFRDRWRAWKPHTSWKMVLLLTILVFTGTANRVSFKVMTNSTIFRIDELGNQVSYYGTFLTQFTTILFAPILWAIVAYQSYLTQSITLEMRKFPIWKYAVMGLLDSISGVLMVCGGSGTSGPLQLLLVQGVIPFTMLFSFFSTLPVVSRWIGARLNLRYRWTHIVGATLIFGTVMGAVLPVLLNHGGGQGEDPRYALMFAVSIVPLALSSVYKELAFKGVHLDVYLVCAWVSIFQVFLGFFTLPLSIVTQPNPSAALEHIPNDLYDGMLCFLGRNPLGPKFPNLCAERLVWLHILVYVFFNVLYNIALLLTIKHGSASLSQLASTILLPFTNVCFTFAFVMNEFPPLPPASIPSPPPPAKTNYNDYTNSFSKLDILLFVLVLLGLCLYRFHSETPSNKRRSLEEEVSEIAPMAR